MGGYINNYMRVVTMWTYSAIIVNVSESMEFEYYVNDKDDFDVVYFEGKPQKWVTLDIQQQISVPGLYTVLYGYGSNGDVLVYKIDKISKQVNWGDNWKEQNKDTPDLEGAGC